MVLLVGYAVFFSRMSDSRSMLPPETRRAQALAVDPILLKIISGPFKGLVADYLLLKASVFMGGAWEVSEEDWEAIYMLLKQSLYLDPMFFQSGYYVQGLLSWRTGMQQKAFELMLYHAEHRYWDWEPMFYVGFNAFYFLKDMPKASEYMSLAAERPDAPMIAANLAARMAQKSGQSLTSIALLKTMHDQAEDGWIKEQYALRLEAHLAAYQLEKAISSFSEKFGRFPVYLNELIEYEILPELPENPFGIPFEYESESGRVTFDHLR